MTATISDREIPVRHSVRPDVNREFITFSVPNGWDDVKKVCRKVLHFDGRPFFFSGWNSDRNECFFYRVLNGKQIAAVAMWE
jgi:hypothetical protein